MSVRLDTCMGDAMTWADVGARSRADFVTRCRLEWDAVSADLARSDLTEALDICRLGRTELAALSCDEIRAIYAP